MTYQLRPCVRRKFPNFLFSRVSEIFGFRSSEIFWKKPEIWKFRTFRKLRKNDVLFELRKFENICSDSKTDPKVWLKVRNAGPYYQYYFTLSGSTSVKAFRKMLWNGHQTINVGENDLTSEFLSGAQSLKFDGNVSTDGDKRVLSKQIITINRPLADETRVSNKIKLLVNYPLLYLSLEANIIIKILTPKLILHMLQAFRVWRPINGFQIWFIFT